MKLLANAKINLTLQIKNKLPSGYHEIESIMQSVDLHDTIHIEKGDKISVEFDISGLDGVKNTAFAAADAFFKSAKITGGAHIRIEKGIPLASGMGGGSADAAAVLVGLNRLYGEPLGEKEILNIGKEIGADVPFCIYGGTAVVSGIGEKMRFIKPMPPCIIALAINSAKKSTADMYTAADAMKTKPTVDNAAAEKAIENRDINALCLHLSNTFGELYGSEVAELKNTFSRFGAYGASLSGAGPTVFAIFKNYGKARDCCNKLPNNTSFSSVCRPVSEGITEIFD